MATVSPVSRMSRRRETTTSCCSRMVSTDRTVSTASKAAAIRDEPPTKSWSSPSASPRVRSAASPEATTASTAGLPAVAAAAPTWARGDPSAWAASRAPASARTASSSVVGELDGLLLDGPVGQDHDDQGQPVAEADQLHRPDGGRLVGGTDHHGGAVGEVGEQAGGPLQHLLDLAVGVVEELADLLAPARVEGAGAAQLVDEEPVALVGRDPSGAGVGLGQVPVPLECGHVGAHGGRGDAHPGGVDHVLGSDRLGRADVLGDHGVEDGRLARVETPVTGGRLLGSALSAVVIVLTRWTGPGRGRAPRRSDRSLLALHSSEC